jgi:phosphoglycolate phosphatase
MKNIRNVLFDLDGTLVDSSLTISTCIDYALARLGEESVAGAPVTALIGTPLLDIFRNTFRLTEQQAELAIGHYREHYDRLGQAGSKVYDSVDQVLDDLGRQGYRLFIATVKPTPVAEKVLSDLKLRQYFEGIAGASMGHERREKTGIIAYALEKFDLDPVQSLMVGDRSQDVLGAKDNGMASIAVTYGFGSRDELDAALPDHIVGHSSEILSLLMNPSMAAQSKPMV